MNTAEIVRDRLLDVSKPASLADAGARTSVVVPLFTSTLFVSAFLLFLGSAHGRKDGAAAARRLADGVEHVHGVLPDRAARGLRLRAWRDQMAQPAPAGRCCTSCCCCSRSRCFRSSSAAIRQLRPACTNRMAVPAARRLHRIAVLHPRHQRIGSAALVFAHRAPIRRDPYFLYVASNIGSFVALIAYPALVEPSLSLRESEPLLDGRIWRLRCALIGLRLLCVARRSEASPSSAGRRRAYGDSRRSREAARAGGWRSRSFRRA